MFGFIAKEVIKAVAVSAGVEVIREKIIPPLSKKIKETFGSDKKEEEEKKDSRNVYDVEWE